jgi:hypothetical protein
MRIPRSAGPAALAVVLLGSPVLFGSPAPAQAHGGPAVVEVSAQAGDGAATITALITYADGHAIGSAAVSGEATGAGRALPVRMTETAAGQYTGAVALSAGTWQITVRAAGEPAGTGRATVTIATSPSAPVAPGGGGRASGGVPGWVWTTLAFAGAAVAVVGTRRRARRIADR